MVDASGLSPVGMTVSVRVRYPSPENKERGVLVFNTCISATPFTTEEANASFSNITGLSYKNDVSFVSTLRALLASRISDDERIGFRVVTDTESLRGLMSYSADIRKTITNICRGNSYLTESGQITVVNVSCGNPDDNAEIFKFLRQEFEKAYVGFHRIEKVTDFYRKAFNVDCYINPELKSSVIFVDRLDYKKFHYLQVATLVFLPWYFNPEDGLTDDEKALIQSLRETTHENYCDCLNKFARQQDFRGAKIRRLLAGFETTTDRNLCEKVKGEVLSLDNQIRMLNQQISELFASRENKCVQLLGLQQKIAQNNGESEIMDYFLCNQHLVLDFVTGQTIRFGVKGYLEYFDKDAAEAAINNRSSFVYSVPHLSDMDEEGMKKLMTEIFVADNPMLKIKSCAGYQINLNGNVSPVEDYDFGYEYSGYMPNPHINNYSCMGNYTQIINDLLMNRDYLGAIEQCIASCASLNWNDPTVMESFMKRIWQGGSRCIELPNGDVVASKEAIRWLDAQEIRQDEKTEEAQENE